MNHVEKKEYLEIVSSILVAYGIRHFTAGEIVGNTDETKDGVANSLPLIEYVFNAIPTLIILDDVRESTGAPIIIKGMYRNPEYNKAWGGALQSQHLIMAGADAASPELGPNQFFARIAMRIGRTFYTPLNFTHVTIKDRIIPWHRDGLEMRPVQGGYVWTFHGGIKEYLWGVHIDCRGTDARW